MAFKIDEKKKPVVTVFSILAICISFIIIFRTYYEPTPKVPLEPFMAIGQVIAEETAKLLGNKGKVVLIVMEIGNYPMPTAKAQLKSFTETLKKQGGITVAATESVPMNQMIMGGPEMGLPADVFLKVLQQHTDADAIVSFVGAPHLNDDQIGGLGDKIPKFVAVTNLGMMGPGLKKLFEEQVIQLAIVPRFDPAPPNTKKPVTLREFFDQSYKVITAENASSLPF